MAAATKETTSDGRRAHQNSTVLNETKGIVVGEKWILSEHNEHNNSNGGAAYGHQNVLVLITRTPPEFGETLNHRNKQQQNLQKILLA